ncbi:MAG: 6-bladed beta-propeller [Bacteroidales bacterium]|nr:6-bladed beta-propeller [Bacteroidales bacterium]
MNKLFLVFLLSFLIFGCKENKHNEHYVIIDLNNVLSSENSNDQLAIEEVKMIPLETTDESLISFITKIDICDKYLYICDLYQGSSLAIFDINGKFVKRLPKGNGQGEIYNLGCFAYDKYRDLLLIYQYGSISTFSANGKYINSFEFPNYVTDFIALPDGYLFVQSELHNKDQEFSILRTDIAFNIIETIGIEAPFSFGMVNHLSYSENDGITIPHPFDNNIYIYNGDGVSVKERLNFSDYQLDISTIDGGYLSLDETLAKTNKLVFGGILYETNNYEYIQLEGNMIVKPLLINKYSKKCYPGLLQQLPINITLNALNNYFVGYVASDMVAFRTQEEEDAYYDKLTALSTEQISLLRSSSPDDNPIIILYSIKNTYN